MTWGWCSPVSVDRRAGEELLSLIADPERDDILRLEVMRDDFADPERDDISRLEVVRNDFVDPERDNISRLEGNLVPVAVGAVADWRNVTVSSSSPGSSKDNLELFACSSSSRLAIAGLNKPLLNSIPASSVARLGVGLDRGVGAGLDRGVGAESIGTGAGRLVPQYRRL